MVKWFKDTYQKGKEKTLSIVNQVQHGKDKVALKYMISGLMKDVQELGDLKPGDIRYIDLHNDLVKMIDSYLVTYPNDADEMYSLVSV